MIQEYCTSLKIFKEVTCIITLENVPTLPRYIPTMYGIQQSLTEMAKDKDAVTSAFRKQLAFEIEYRFDFINDSDTLTTAMLIDPRVKDKLLPVTKKESAYAVLRLIVAEHLDADETNSTASVRSTLTQTSSECEIIKKLRDILLKIVCNILYFNCSVGCRHLV